jgi:hypothetical protein
MTAAECRALVAAAATNWPVSVYADDADSVICDADPSPTGRACVSVIYRDGSQARHRTVARFDTFEEADAFIQTVVAGMPDNVTVI